MPPKRVSPPRIFPAPSRAGRPPAESSSADAHRQTGFVLGEEVDLVAVGLEHEGACAQASSGAKYRKQATAAAMGLWSRAWLSRMEALHALEWGNYAAAMPLVRAAADYQACEVLLLQTGAAEWNEWLDQEGVALDPEAHGTRFLLHPFRAAEVLAAHSILGPIYRESSALALPHFGATLTLAGSDSSPERVLMTFGDRDFHLSLAELVLGWLLGLGVAQCETVHGYPEFLAEAAAADLDNWIASATAARERQDRCRMSNDDRPGGGEFVIANWRRLPRDARKKLVL